MPDPTEAQTRKDLIDPALEKAGWDLSNKQQVGQEIPVDDTDPQVWQRLQAKLQTVPFALQQKFARIVQKYKLLCAQQRKSARQAEMLFQSLLHGAFGEGVNN